MSTKSILRFKLIAMLIVPIIAELTLVVLEFRRVLPPGPMFPAHAVIYVFIVISAVRFKRRCLECGKWQAMRETSREEINRMEHPRKKTRGNKPKRYQVRFNVWKTCKHCGKERLDEIIKEIKVK